MGEAGISPGLLDAQLARLFVKAMKSSAARNWALDLQDHPATLYATLHTSAGAEHGMVHDGLQADGYIELRLDWKAPGKKVRAPPC